jgi:hypothetical protein
MAKTFVFGWVRLIDDTTSHDNPLHRYLHRTPLPLKLEGLGRQLVFAVEETEMKNVLSLLESDRHVVSQESGRYTLLADQDPSEYQVQIRYGGEPSYYLGRIQQKKVELFTSLENSQQVY